MTQKLRYNPSARTVADSYAGNVGVDAYGTLLTSARTLANGCGCASEYGTITGISELRTRWLKNRLARRQKILSATTKGISERRHEAKRRRKARKRARKKAWASIRRAWR